MMYAGGSNGSRGCDNVKRDWQAAGLFFFENYFSFFDGFFSLAEFMWSIIFSMIIFFM